ncbi:hypothetical protein CA51_27110 [Rosistilla oblonga]|nr:hypothetical protein CA51_27110 [Rosistilla oblonga]
MQFTGDAVVTFLNWTINYRNPVIATVIRLKRIL